MKVQLEIKHLVKHLPFWLKGDAINREYYEDQINKELYRIETGKTKYNNYTIDPFIQVGEIECEIKDFKPYLRPLSDLTKSIVHNGEEFIPIDGIYNDKLDSSSIETMHGAFTLGQSMSDLGKLLKWHFDVDGLIDKGMAIDVNNLEVNPYK